MKPNNLEDQQSGACTQAQDPIPVVIDLDGTLCRTDTLHESVLQLLAKQPSTLLQLRGWMAAGKESMKREIADRELLDPALLPYDTDVLRLIETARSEGRRVVLVSAADYRQVEAVAAHLGVFDEAIGTGGSLSKDNLRGKAKADFLVAKYGKHGFDYVGDSITDVPVWEAARRSYGIRLSSATKRAAAVRKLDLTELSPGKDVSLRALIRACRPHQWAKNVLILLPVITAHEFSKLPVALLAMLCFSLVASAIYILNDLIDLHADRVHPRKRNRPFASGDANVVQGLIASAGLLILATSASALLLPLNFLLILLVYIVTTTAYSIWLKRKMMVDVIGLASLYTLRIVAGGLATEITLSPWLIVFSMFLFFALATIKRQAELEDLAARGIDKTVGRNLLVADLPILQGMSIGAAQIAVLVFAVYSQAPEVQRHFAFPDLLLLICPVLFLWLGRMQLMTRRGYMTDDPIVFTFRDRVSRFCGVLMLAIFMLAAWGSH